MDTRATIKKYFKPQTNENPYKLHLYYNSPSSLEVKLTDLVQKSALKNGFLVLKSLRMKVLTVKPIFKYNQALV